MKAPGGTNFSGTTDSRDRAAPRPEAIIEALRSLGYTLETAIADLVDNSISHRAGTVRVRFDWRGGDSLISLSDDGCGMTETELVAAMTFGTFSPREARAPDDLGRFGLGLKTASLSQAGRMTVFSRFVGNEVVVRIWDVPYVTLQKDWLLLREPTPAASNHAKWLLEQRSGTCVVWERLDRLVGQADIDDDYEHRTFLEGASRVARHLSMVFGDFLAGTKGVRMEVGNERLKKWDPFLANHSATQHLPPETLRFGSSCVTVQPYVLPHHSRLDREEFDRAAGIHGWNAHQGFYIYRNSRLLVAGGWLSLGFTRDEHLKLARIRVDLGNEADFAWNLDVRKSMASPPIQLRESLRRIARVTRERAQEVYRHRGKKLLVSSPTDHSAIWEARLMRGRTVFRVCRDHPLVRALVSDGDAGRGVEALLKLLEQTIPLASIYIRHAEAPNEQSAPFEDVKDKECLAMLTSLYLVLAQSGRSHQQALATLSALPLVAERPHLLVSLNETPPKAAEID